MPSPFRLVAPGRLVPAGLSAGLLATIGLALGAGPPPAAVDLEVAIPPGSPLDLGHSFPAVTPPRQALFARSPRLDRRAPDRTTSRKKRVDLDVRITSAFGLVRILTWDIGGHVSWMNPRRLATDRPSSGRSGLRPEPPRYGDALWWVSMAPLLRLMLHPHAVSRAETIAHLVELGDPVLPVLSIASQEASLRRPCATVRELVGARARQAFVLEGEAAPVEASARQLMLQRFVREECLRAEPYDPEGAFGERLFLFSEQLEPILWQATADRSRELRRNAVAALARYRTTSAMRALVEVAGSERDAVAVVRACAGLGRFDTPLEYSPLVDRLALEREPALRVSLIGALGRARAKEAVPVLLRLGRNAFQGKDADLLLAVLAALARIAPRSDEKALVFLAEVHDSLRLRHRIFPPPGVRSTHEPDNPDGPLMRSRMLEQLALLARSACEPGDEEHAARLLEVDVPFAYSNLLWLEALGRLGPAGVERLRAFVSSDEDAIVRGHALTHLPLAERVPLAAELVAAGGDASLRVSALQVLVADAYVDLTKLCKALLAEAAALPSGEGDPAARYLYQQAVRTLSEAGRLATSDLVPLLHHARAARHAHGTIPMRSSRRWTRS